MTTDKKKPKKKSLPLLKKQTWKLFSLMVRLEAADKNGMVECVACLGEGKTTKIHYKESHAAHYIPKSQGLRIYFEKKNVHPCCAGCNLFKHGNLYSYAIWLERHYGGGILQELQAVKNIKLGGIAAREFVENVIIETKKKLTFLKNLSNIT